MQITLLDTVAKQIEAALISPPPEREAKLQLGFDVGFTDERQDIFLVIFNGRVVGRIPDIDDGYELSVEYMARFQTDEPIDDEFKRSHFVKQNAPAIAFPFFRAYLANIALLSGYGPLILPAVNFTKLKPSSDIDQEQIVGSDTKPED